MSRTVRDEIQGAEDILTSRIEADKSFYRDYSEQYYPMQDVNDRRFRYVELTHPGPFLGPVCEKKAGAAATQSVDGYTSVDCGQGQWKISKAEARALGKDGRITWMDVPR